MNAQELHILLELYPVGSLVGHAAYIERVIILLQALKAKGLALDFVYPRTVTVLWKRTQLGDEIVAKLLYQANQWIGEAQNAKIIKSSREG